MQWQCQYLALAVLAVPVPSVLGTGTGSTGSGVECSLKEFSTVNCNAVVVVKYIKDQCCGVEKCAVVIYSAKEFSEVNQSAVRGMK